MRSLQHANRIESADRKQHLRFLDRIGEAMHEMTLNSLKPGERGTIDRITTSAPKIRERLMEMGLIRGTPVELIRYAPMGDPIEVKVKGYRLSLRRVEAESVVVKKNTT